MALAALKTWLAGEVLTASDLNAMNTNILNNALALISPLTGTLNVNNNQLTNMRLEVQTATQTSAFSGRAYWQSTEGTLHIDTGTLIGRTPAITALEQNMLIGAVNPTGVSGATTYAGLRLGTGLSIAGNNTLNASAAAAAGATVLQTQVFS